MSNEQKEQKLEKLYAYINYLHDMIKDLQDENLRQHQKLEVKEQRIAQLEEVIYYLEREKWSIESELENLRGY